MTIAIPNAVEEERIGSSLNHLIKVIRDTETARGEVVWDFSRVCFLHPCFIAPLAIYRLTCGRSVRCINASSYVGGYLDSIYFSNPLHFASDSSCAIEEILRRYVDKTYTPVCSFAMTDENKDAFGTIIKNVIVSQSSLPPQGVNPVSYFIGELLDNIYEHSRSERGFVFSQYLKREGMIYLCIADEGIGIYNSYKLADAYLDEIDGHEEVALYLANEGRSTKERASAETRGYGISTSKRMLVEGMGGAFFMLSGGAFHRYSNNGENDYVNIGNIFRWNGTIILLRIPVTMPSGFNYINFIE